MRGNVSLYNKGLNSKVKLALYRTFSKEVRFKKYLHGVCDAVGSYLSLGQGHMG